MKKISLIIFVAALAISCDKKQNETTETATETAVNQTKDSAVVAATENPSVQTQEVQVNAPQQAQNGQVVPQNTAAANPSGKKPALNPAHGEPFHRCDIAVGAPIDSAPAPQNPAPQPQAPVNNNFNTNPIPAAPQQTAPVTQNIGPKPAVNPPHGEPHHRCDLQVGAPLI